MRRSLPLVWCLSGLLAASATFAGEVKLNGQTFTLPDGFTIETIAAPPLVDRPIVCDFDDKGRLYVADSSGSNDNVQKQLEEKPHRILCLYDDDGDGRFDRRTVFADRMMFPEGCLWYDGSLYIAAPPSIWKLTDTNGDGVADKREEWFQGKTLTGCANDLHGPYLGPDGRIYWCKGAFAKQTYRLPNGKEFTTRASHIFRAKPDGSEVEPVMTGGMDNPVDVVFTPTGERIFSTTFLQHPEAGRRDGLIHAYYGAVFGKDHDVLDGHPRTQPGLSPPMTHLGPAAPCGLCRYESAVFGFEYQDNLFCCQFNMRKVSRHILKPKGATFETVDSDFVVSDGRDFHPTDVQEDADGSLVVVDTGGWYKLCCPTSQLQKPDVLGAIYRVRKVGAGKVVDPRGLTLEWDKAESMALARRLGDDRPAVQRRAIETMAKRGALAVPAIAEVLQPIGRRRDRSVRARLAAVWTLARIDDPAARLALSDALSRDVSDEVTTASVRALGLGRDSERRPRADITRRLAMAGAGPVEPNATDTLRRATRLALAETAGRSGVAVPLQNWLPFFIEPAAKSGDPVLIVAWTRALIDAASTAELTQWLRLRDRPPAFRRMLLVALDQTDPTSTPRDSVLALLDSDDSETAAVAWWISSRHPEWAPAIAAMVRDRLADARMTDAALSDLEARLRPFVGEPAFREWLAGATRADKHTRRIRTFALRMIGRSGLKSLPPEWSDALRNAVSGGQPEIVAAAVASLRMLPPEARNSAEVAETLLDAAGNPTLGDATRLAALAALPDKSPALDAPLWDFLRARLAPGEAVALRLSAADLVARIPLDDTRRAQVIEILRTAGPLELDRLLNAFAGRTDEATGLALVKALREAQSVTSLRVETLKQRLDKFGPNVTKEAESSLYPILSADAEERKAKLESTLATITGGDIRRGQAVFNGTKAACATCHTIGYVGGKVGPDLTRIGQVRTERDLLESILFPSASFVRSYEPVTLATNDGRVFNGILKKDADDEVVLTVNATEEARVARSAIEEMRPGTASVMPTGLDAQLSKQELADLVAFLKACR